MAQQVQNRGLEEEATITLFFFFERGERNLQSKGVRLKVVGRGDTDCHWAEVDIWLFDP